MSNARRFNLDLVPETLDAVSVTPAIAVASVNVPAGFVVVAFWNPWVLAGAVLAHARLAALAAAAAAATQRPEVVTPATPLPATYSLN